MWSHLTIIAKNENQGLIVVPFISMTLEKALPVTLYAIPQSDISEKL